MYVTDAPSEFKQLLLFFSWPNTFSYLHQSAAFYCTHRNSYIGWGNSIRLVLSVTLTLHKTQSQFLLIFMTESFHKPLYYVILCLYIIVFIGCIPSVRLPHRCSCWHSQTEAFSIPYGWPRSTCQPRICKRSSQTGTSRKKQENEVKVLHIKSVFYNENAGTKFVYL